MTEERGSSRSLPSSRGTDSLATRDAEPSAARYRGYDIYPTDPVPPIPGWQKFAWTYAHKDYDGPEDGRCGCAASVAECKAEIDEREGDLPEGWQAAQAARCPCRGCDDYCPCINEYAPERYGLTETEKCGECGLLASSLMHRFCQRENCPEGSARSQPAMVRCGACKHFVRDGRCDAEQFGPNPPFWVWSDCYSDREQVRANVESACPAFIAKATSTPA